MGIRKPNNAGLVITTAGPDVVHTIPTANPTTVIIRKIMWSNNTGIGGTLIFGTQDNVAAPGWIPLLPTITCLNGFDGEIREEDLPEIEFSFNAAVGVLGTTGNILVQVAPAGAIGILIRLEVEEIREGR